MKYEGKKFLKIKLNQMYFNCFTNVNYGTRILSTSLLIDFHLILAKLEPPF